MSAGMLVGGASLVAAWGVANMSPSLVVATTAVLGLIALAAVDPVVPCAALLVCESTIFDPNALPEIHRIKPVEILLLVATVSAFTHSRGVPATRWERIIGRYLLVYMVFDCLAVVVGLTTGSTLTTAMQGFRPSLLIAAYWPVVWTMRARRRRRWLLGCAAVSGLVVAVLQVIQYEIGVLGLRLFVTSPTSSVFSVDGGALRVRAPGLTLAYAVGIWALAVAIWGRGKRRLVGLAMFGLMLAAVLVSLNRNMVLGLFAGVFLALMALPQRRKVVATLAAAGLLGTLVVAIGGVQASGLIYHRFASVINPATLQSGSIQDREYENRLAIAALKKHPLFGIGWGTSYGATITRTVAGETMTQNRPFVQLQYLELWLRTGFAGMAAFCAAVLGGLGASFWGFRRGQPAEREAAGGTLMALTALAVGALVATYFSTPSALLVVAGVLATSATLTSGHQEARLVSA